MQDIDNDEEVKKLIARGEFVVKELEALYKLRKYRAMKQKYYADETYEETIVKNIKQFEDDDK